MGRAGWVPASDGIIPSGSLVSGYESNGEELYACRAKFNGGVHPGETRGGFKGCSIGWGGKEIAVKQYETYVVWQRAAGGKVPSSAIVTGNESSGEKLYLCRAKYNGVVHSGKVRGAYGACNISLGGGEVKVNPYEVLVH